MGPENSFFGFLVVTTETIHCLHYLKSFQMLKTGTRSSQSCSRISQSHHCIKLFQVTFSQLSAILCICINAQLYTGGKKAFVDFQASPSKLPSLQGLAFTVVWISLSRLSVLCALSYVTTWNPRVTWWDLENGSFFVCLEVFNHSLCSLLSLPSICSWLVGFVCMCIVLFDALHSLKQQCESIHSLLLSIGQNQKWHLRVLIF